MNLSDYCIVILIFLIVITAYQPSVKYTCSVENGCEPDLYGTYDTLQECKQSCMKI